MRIYSVIFEGRPKTGDEEWGRDFALEKVALEDGGATEAIQGAFNRVEIEDGFELRATEVKLLAESP